MSDVSTIQVRWPKKFGEQLVFINETDFDPKIHTRFVLDAAAEPADPAEAPAESSEAEPAKAEAPPAPKAKRAPRKKAKK